MGRPPVLEVQRGLGHPVRLPVPLRLVRLVPPLRLMLPLGLGPPEGLGYLESLLVPQRRDSPYDVHQSLQRHPNATEQVCDALGCLSTLSILAPKYDSPHD